MRLAARSLATARARSKSRALSSAPPAKQGLPTEKAAAKDRRALKKTQAKHFALRGVAGESDRAIPAKMPKHLFSGKRGIGKTDWR